MQDEAQHVNAAGDVEMKKAKQMEDEAQHEKAAADLQMQPAFHVVVDSMDDAFNAEFKAWPQGVYVAQAGRLVYSSDSGEDSPGYDVQELFEFWMESMTALQLVVMRRTLLLSDMADLLFINLILVL